MRDEEDPFAAIETVRLRLRCAQERDAHALARLMTPEISARLASWPEALSVLESRDRIRAIRLKAQERQAVPFVIEPRFDRDVAGWLSIVQTTDDPTTATVTYWLHKAHRGKGLLREAAPVALAYAFANLGIKRVRAAVQTDNGASLAVIASLGMRPLGPGRIWCAARNQEEDCLWFELAAGDVANLEGTVVAGHGTTPETVSPPADEPPPEICGANHQCPLGRSARGGHPGSRPRSPALQARQRGAAKARP